MTGGDRLEGRGQVGERIDPVELAGLDEGGDPQAWLADALARIASTPMSRLDELLPWNWIAAQQSPRVKAA